MAHRSRLLAKLTSAQGQASGLALGYCCVAIALLTLNPFDFQAYRPSEFWVCRFRLGDVLQNILLFIPLGILLRQGLRLPYGFCLLWGLLLSLGIETAQLWLVARTSNLFDLGSNALGAGLGAWLYQWVLARSDRSPSPQPLAMMILPLCWIRAIVAEGQPNSEWLILPGAIAAIALLRPPDLSSHLALSGNPVWRQLGPQLGPHCWPVLLWLLLALVPVMNNQPVLAPLIAIAALALERLAARWLGLSRWQICLLGLWVGFGLGARVDGLWLWGLRAYGTEGWYKLRWIEIMLSGWVLASAVWFVRRPGQNS
ncbi:MAG: VanZ family protein [Synechococcales cyanobacterium RM1_1_8]|nr:VanZ family protein [Synechococcales cyanobacterium RM1_1_8]